VTMSGELACLRFAPCKRRGCRIGIAQGDNIRGGLRYSDIPACSRACVTKIRSQTTARPALGRASTAQRVLNDRRLFGDERQQYLRWPERLPSPLFPVRHGALRDTSAFGELGRRQPGLLAPLVASLLALCEGPRCFEHLGHRYKRALLSSPNLAMIARLIWTVADCRTRGARPFPCWFTSRLRWQRTTRLETRGALV